MRILELLLKVDDTTLQVKVNLAIVENEKSSTDPQGHEIWLLPMCLQALQDPIKCNIQVAPVKLRPASGIITVVRPEDNVD